MSNNNEKLAVCNLSTESTYKYARANIITLPHGNIYTPVFMPVGTQGTMKGLTSDQLRTIDCKIILSNTYHLGNRPGTDKLDKIGGLHRFMNWDRNILTDSGGFQMVSLVKLATFTEAGVIFKSPIDGTELLLTPEKSIKYQNEIGSDIIMMLDDVVSSTSVDFDRYKLATERTIRWLDRSIQAHKKKINKIYLL